MGNAFTETRFLFPAKPHPSHPISVQLSLGVCTLLKCRSRRFLSTFAIKCASWTGINRGTSQRSANNSLGFHGISPAFPFQTAWLCGTFSEWKRKVLKRPYFKIYLVIYCAMQDLVFQLGWVPSGSDVSHLGFSMRLILMNHLRFVLPTKDNIPSIVDNSLGWMLAAWAAVWVIASVLPLLSGIPVQTLLCLWW